MTSTQQILLIASALALWGALTYLICKAIDRYYGVKKAAEPKRTSKDYAREVEELIAQHRADRFSHRASEASASYYNHPKHIEPITAVGAYVGVGCPCDQCDTVCLTPEGLAVHKARNHRG